MNKQISRSVVWFQDRRTIRVTVIGVLITLAALFVASRVASASAPLKAIGALASPITQPVTVTLDCDDGWNPSCQPTADTASGGMLRSYFYIDGRSRGPANVVYTNVCSRFRLADGFHTAMVYAVDSFRNSARVGPYRIIQCDRTGPYITSGLRYYRNVVTLAPYASDRWSGVATEVLKIDGTDETWDNYSNVCTAFSLSSGAHSVLVSATDNVGNTSSSLRTFYCR
jgi:hypothetical protein